MSVLRSTYSNGSLFLMTEGDVEVVLFTRDGSSGCNPVAIKSFSSVGGETINVRDTHTIAVLGRLEAVTLAEKRSCCGSGTETCNGPHEVTMKRDEWIASVTPATVQVNCDTDCDGIDDRCVPDMCDTDIDAGPYVDNDVDACDPDHD